MIVIVLFLLLFWMILRLKLSVQITARGTRRIDAVLRVGKLTVFRMPLILVFREQVIPYLYWERKKVCIRMFPNSDKFKKRRPEWIKYVIRKSYKIEKLHIDAVIGTQDAAETAYAVGVVQIAIRNAVMLLKGKKEDVSVRIRPDFSKETLKVDLDCIIFASLADIIRNAIFRKGGKKYASNRKHLKEYNV